MAFTSLAYLGFLVSIVLLYHLFPQRLRLTLLCLAGYVFYGYAETYYVLILAFSTAVDYVVGLLLQSLIRPLLRKCVLALSIAVNLALLGFFKYTNFALDSFQPFFARLGLDTPALEIALPLGISFYTFKSLSYTIDVYQRKVVATRNPILFATFVNYFPQLIAGPIERAGSLIPQLQASLRSRADQFWNGLELILAGLVKKLVLADRLYLFSGPVFLEPEVGTPWDLWLGLPIMVIALYLDFSGYTDLARGSSKLLGIDLSPNFRFPFASTSPADYWQRWHITLSTWIRDYVFLPLGGAIRRKPGRTAANFLAAMALIGLWHGANLKFVLWGLIWGVVLAANYFIRIQIIARYHLKPSSFFTVGGWIITRAVSFLIAPLFFCPALSTAVVYWKKLAWPGPLGLTIPQAIAAGFVILFLLSQIVLDKFKASWWSELPTPWRGLAFAGLFYLALLFSVPVNRQFYYFQF